MSTSFLIVAAVCLASTLCLHLPSQHNGLGLRESPYNGIARLRESRPRGQTVDQLSTHDLNSAADAKPFKEESDSSESEESIEDLDSSYYIDDSDSDDEDDSLDSNNDLDPIDYSPGLQSRTLNRVSNSSDCRTINYGSSPVNCSTGKGINAHTLDGNTTRLNSSTSKTCDCVCGVERARGQRIVGGVEAGVGQFPWIAALSWRGRFHCGGTLITRRHVMTAAHCVHGFRAEELKVTLGEHDRSRRNETRTQVRRVASITRHPQFSLQSFDNDIALLVMTSAVDVDAPGLATACLSRRSGANHSGECAVVAGWGRESERRGVTAQLRKVAVPIMSRTQCLASGYPSKKLTPNMFCAGYREGAKDACQGDSGGPLHLNTTTGMMEVIGIVSWGRGCARPNYPGVYTNVANYIPWLKKNIEDDCLCSPPLAVVPPHRLGRVEAKNATCSQKAN